MRIRWLAIALPVLACAERPAVNSAAEAAPQADMRDSTVVALTPAGDPKYPPAWQDSTCGTDTAFAHPAPDALLREYVARNDSLGFFAGGGEDNEAWYFAATECPGHLGGSDGIGVVMSYRVEPLPAGTDSARYVVHYQLAGGVAADITDATDTPAASRFTLAPESVADSLLLVRTPYGWRISGQPVGVFMAPGAVARQIQLPADDRARLDSLAQVRAVTPGRGA